MTALETSISLSRIRRTATVLPHENPELFETIKRQSRINIRHFVSSCINRSPSCLPYVDVACGYRTHKPEVIHSSHFVDPLYVAFDHVLVFDKEVEPISSPNMAADAELIPLKDRCAGTVLCTEVLEHVRNPHLVLNEVYRILKPSGKLLLTVPGIHVPKHEKLPHQRDYRRFSKVYLRQLLKEHNFTILEMQDKFFEGKHINILVWALRT